MSEVISDPLVGSFTQTEDSGLRLEGRWYILGRAIWILLALAALVMFFTSLPGYALSLSLGVSHAPSIDTSIGTMILNILKALASISSVLLSFTLAGLLFWRRFDELMSALISFYLLLYGIVMAGVLEHWAYYWIGDLTFATLLQGLLLATPTFALLMLFPNGRFVPRWTRWAVLVSFSWNAIFFLMPEFSPIDTPFELPLPAAIVWFFSMPVLGVWA